MGSRRNFLGNDKKRNSASGVTSHPARLGRASAAAIAPSNVRTASVASGRFDLSAQHTWQVA